MKGIVAVLMLTTIQLTGQGLLQVEQPFSGWTHYSGDVTHIVHFNNLPDDIKTQAKFHLFQHLGSFCDSLIFSHGQIIYSSDSLQVRSEKHLPSYPTPTYDLHFKLADGSIGLVSYYLIVQLDQQGQLLKINWPRKKYRDKQFLVSRQDMETFAMRSAKSRLLNITSYQQTCQYREDIDQLVWVFEFQYLLSLPEDPRWQVLEFPWTNLTVSGDYERQRHSSH